MGYCPPLSNSWIITIIRLYIALDRTPHIELLGEGSTQVIEGLLKGSIPSFPADQR